MAKLFNGMIPFASAINPTGAQPLDDRFVVQSYSDLTNASTFGTAVYVGMFVSVIDDQKIYILTNKDVTAEGAWVAAGSGSGSVSASEFTFDENGKIVEATSENIGQIIYLTTSQTVGEGEDAVTYTAGPYIVTGDGAISKVGTSAADGSDFASQIAALEGAVSTLRSEVTKQAAQDTTHTEAITNIQTTSDNNSAAITTLSSTVNDNSTKLGGIESGAQVNIIEVVKVGETALTVTDKAVNIDLSSYATKDDLTPKLEASDLADYAKTADVVAVTTFNAYKEEVTEALSSIPKFNIEVVDVLPTENISVSTVYLVTDGGSADGNLYTEYIYVNNSWEILGEQKLDLSGYSTTEQMNSAISAAVEEHAANYYTSNEVDTKLGDYLKSADAESTYVKITEGSRLMTNEEGEALAAASSDIATIKTTLGAIKVTDVDTTASHGVALTKSEEGLIGISVTPSDVATSLIGATGEVGPVSGISVKLGQAITDGNAENPTEIISATTSVYAAIQTIAGQVQAAVAGGITSIDGGEYITVGGTATAKTLTLDTTKVTETVTANIVSEDSPIHLNESGKLDLFWSEE